VTDSADATYIGTLFEKPGSSYHVTGKIPGRGFGNTASRTANATVVVTQHGDSSARELISQHPENFKAENFLVAVLRTTAGNQHRCRVRSGIARQRKGTGKTVFAVGKLYVQFVVRQIFLFSLSRRRIHSLELKRAFHPRLHKRPTDNVPFEFSIKRSNRHTGNFKVHVRIIEGHLLQ